MIRDIRFIIGLSLWAAVSACNGCLGCTSPVDQTGSNLPPSCQTEAPLVDAQKLDVLFVVDNSNSMREEQEGVARELTSFVSELRSAGGVQQDIRVGLITTTVYQHFNQNGVDTWWDCNDHSPYCFYGGKLQPVPDALPDGGVFLGTGGSQRVLDNDDPQLVEKFSRLVQVGIFGSGEETPFEAIRLAFSPPLSETPVAMGGTQGFLRDGARLLIVVLSDEDDCSESLRPAKVVIGTDPAIDYCGNQGNFLTPVADYHKIFTEQIRDDAGTLKDIVYTAIAPVGMTTKDAMAILAPQQTQDGGTYQTLRNIDCPTSNGPGIRHRQMAEMFDATLANLDSICQPSYHDTLENIAALAGVSQVLELTGGVPDPGVVKIEITRKDDAVQPCTVSNGGLTIEMPTSINPKTRVHFSSTCLRRRDDLGLMVSLLCAF